MAFKCKKKHTCSWAWKALARNANITLVSLSLYHSWKAELSKIPISQHFLLSNSVCTNQYFSWVPILPNETFPVFFAASLDFFSLIFQILPENFMGFITTYNFFKFVLKYPCPCDIYVILITKDENLKVIIIKIWEHGVYFLSVLTMACMKLQFLIHFQRRQLKMPSSVHAMPVQLEQRTATMLFHLFAFWKTWLTWSKPTATDQVNAWGQSENRASKDQRENRSEKEKEKSDSSPKSFSWFAIFFYDLLSWGSKTALSSKPLAMVSSVNGSLLEIQTGQYQNRCYIWFTNFVIIISRTISFLEWEDNTLAENM